MLRTRVRDGCRGSDRPSVSVVADVRSGDRRRVATPSRVPAFSDGVSMTTHERCSCGLTDASWFDGVGTARAGCRSSGRSSGCHQAPIRHRPYRNLVMLPVVLAVLRARHDRCRRSEGFEADAAAHLDEPHWRVDGRRACLPGSPRVWPVAQAGYLGLCCCGSRCGALFSRWRLWWPDGRLVVCGGARPGKIRPRDEHRGRCRGEGCGGA